MAGTGNEATSQETATVAADEATLDALLGGQSDSGSSADATQTEESAAETEAPETETDSGEESQVEETSDRGGDSEEESEAEGAEEEAEEEESDLSITESDRDYSESAYKKAADHYARTKKIELNPNDPAHRALLKEIMDRGEALKRQKVAEEAEEAEADEADATKTETQIQPTKPSPEQIQSFIANAATVAKKRIIPEVAMHVATSLTKALWADEAPELSQEQANGITEALSQMFWMQLEDALPAIHGATREFLGTDPVFGHVEQITLRERAFDRLEAVVDKTTGKPKYPELERMAMSGALKRAMKANPFIQNIVSGDGRDRVANEAARIDAAYKIARGEQVNPDVVRRAVETGKKNEVDRNKKIAAGRTTPGKTKGEIGRQVPAGQKLVGDITSGSGSKFSAAIARDLVTPKN